VKRAFCAMVWLFVVACGGDQDREAALKKEIEQLKTERVEIAAVEKAKAEVAAVEARLEAARQENTAKQASLADLEKKRDVRRRAASSERERTAKLGTEKAQALEQAKQAVEAAQQLDQKIAHAQARALWARDQLALFAHEIQPEDAAWATTRRLAALREFVARTHKEWGDDPELSDSAAELESVGGADHAAAEKARAVAGRLSARFSRIYELPSAEEIAAQRARRMQPAAAAAAQNTPESEPAAEPGAAASKPPATPDATASGDAPATPGAGVGGDAPPTP